MDSRTFCLRLPALSRSSRSEKLSTTGGVPQRCRSPLSVRTKRVRQAEELLRRQQHPPQGCQMLSESRSIEAAESAFEALDLASAGGPKRYINPPLTFASHSAFHCKVCEESVCAQCLGDSKVDRPRLVPCYQTRSNDGTIWTYRHAVGAIVLLKMPEAGGPTCPVHRTGRCDGSPAQASLRC